jgi:predicted transcriptional regulator
VTEQVFNHIKTNAGQGVEQIAKALGTTTKELTLPIRKLLAEKKVTSKGQKRATRYFPR